MMSILNKNAIIPFATHMNVCFILHANVKCKDPIDHFVKIKMIDEFYYFNLEIQLQNINSCVTMVAHYITLIIQYILSS